MGLFLLSKKGLYTLKTFLGAYFGHFLIKILK